MKCQKCGLADASVHVLQINDDGKKSLWLCPTCAGRMKGSFAGADWDRDQDADSVPFPERDSADQDQDLSAILGHFFAPELEGESGVDELVCPACGYKLSRLQDETRLGCATCYVTFRRRLRPVIQRFHRHLSHLGRTPANHTEADNQVNELIRVRIELEHAIAAENFEKAALLRDRIHELDAAENPSAEGT